jgi:hypothetical protein
MLSPESAAAMAARQGATAPAWLGWSRRRLLGAVIGGWRQNRDKLTHLFALIGAFFRPTLVRQRLTRLRDHGFIEAVPSIAQLVVGARDQMILNATVETRLFYQSQGIPWVFHNLRRFISGPATVMDPVGLFSPRDALVHHVLQTFHRHPVYDLALLCAHEGGLDAMASQAEALLAGTHPHQAALTSLIEDGAYHARLPQEIAAFRADPHAPARPIPAGLLADPELMLGMDQFKDLRGLTNYAHRLQVTTWDAFTGWLAVFFDATLGSLLHVRLGPRHLQLDACDPDLVQRHMTPDRHARAAQ